MPSAIVLFKYKLYKWKKILQISSLKVLNDCKRFAGPSTEWLRAGVWSLRGRARMRAPWILEETVLFSRSTWNWNDFQNDSCIWSYSSLLLRLDFFHHQGDVLHLHDGQMPKRFWTRNLQHGRMVQRNGLSWAVYTMVSFVSICRVHRTAICTFSHCLPCSMILKKCTVQMSSWLFSGPCLYECICLILRFRFLVSNFDIYDLWSNKKSDGHDVKFYDFAYRKNLGGH